MWFGFPALLLDARNRILFGADAPKQFQLVYCLPNDIKYISLSSAEPTFPFSKFISGGDWDKQKVPLTPYSNEGGREWHSTPKDEQDRLAAINASKQKIALKRSWQEVGEYQRLLDGITKDGQKDGFRSLQELEKRFKDLDVIISEFKSGEKYLSQNELYGISFRELGGLNVALDRDGAMIFLHSDGHHRLGVAQQLQLPCIPVCLSLVHWDCVANGTFHKIMVKSNALSKMRDASKPDR